jgi:hypothetical protein
MASWSRFINCGDSNYSNYCRDSNCGDRTLALNYSTSHSSVMVQSWFSDREICCIHWIGCRELKGPGDAMFRSLPLNLQQPSQRTLLCLK